jgi:hypothetical protein
VACQPWQCGFIFSVRTFYSITSTLVPPSERITWGADWSFAQPGPTGMYDIMLTVKTDDQLPDTTEVRRQVMAIPTPGVYRFDGKVYRLVGTQIELGK